MRGLVRFITVLCALVCASAPAVAQTYPDRPIRLIVAFAAGGGTDTLARQISYDLTAALGQPVIVENRPGASGRAAWEHVAASSPDGYTLLIAENALAISQALYKKTRSSFDPLTQYDAIAHIAVSPSALIVSNRVRANTVADLVRQSRTALGKMSYASAGVGTVSHLNFEVFKDKMEMEAVHVPYKGGGEAINNVVAGHVPMTISSVQVSKRLVDADKVKALAVTSLVRSPAMPDVPTMQEAGVPAADVELRFWFALFGPRGMPAPVKATLAKAVQKVMADPRTRARLARLDITPEFALAPALEAKLTSEIANWTRFIDAKKIKAE